MSEMKKFTRSHDAGDYTLNRKQAQAINFAKIHELLQRNVGKTVNKSYTQYTKDLVKTYLASPGSNIDTIREVSRFLARNSMVYKKLIEYQATMPLYFYSVTQINSLLKDLDPDKCMKEYELVLKKLNSLNMQKEFYTAKASAIRDGMYCGFKYESDNGMFFMPLDVQYCRIYGKTPEGEWIVYFDATYFDSNNNKEFVLGIDGDGVGVWDECFVDGYKQYKSLGKEYRWFRLPPEKTLCLIAGNDDSFNMPLPYYSPLFISLLDLIDLEQILMSRTELENYILLISKIPLISGSEDVDDFALSLELVQQMQDLIDAVVPDLVGTAYSPMELETVKFDKSNSTDDTDKLATSMNNLFNNAGISQLVVAGGSSTNSIGLNHAIENDMAITWKYVNRIESWINYYLKNTFSGEYKFKIHQITWYNRDGYVSNMKDMATLGGNAIDYFVVASGKTPYEVINDARFNSVALNINQWLVPLESSYTMSSSSKSAGAPSKGDNISEEGLKTRDGNKNEGSTSTVQ